jgi:hypothetical protein
MYGDRIEDRYSENMPTPQESSFSFQKRGLRISEMRGMRTNCSPPPMITFQLDSALKAMTWLGRYGGRRISVSAIKNMGR